jgi:hypothetical protein
VDDTPAPVDDTPAPVENNVVAPDSLPEGCPDNWSHCDYVNDNNCYKGPSFGTVNGGACDMHSESELGDTLSPNSCVKKDTQDQNSCYGPLSQHHYTDTEAGKQKTPRHYVYSKRGESCHAACFRVGASKSLDWYCDGDGLFNMDMKTALNGVYANEADVDVKNWGRCSSPTGDEWLNAKDPRSIDKTSLPTSAWSPYMRYDGRCYWTTARGAPKCYTYHPNAFRLCPCADYTSLLGRGANSNDLTVGTLVDAKPSTAGWYMVSQQSCDNFCGSGTDLACDADTHNAFKGADAMRDLEAAFIAARDPADDTHICKQWDDRKVLKMAPSYRATGETCYVNPATATGDAACNIMARKAEDWRWCFCKDTSA